MSHEMSSRLFFKYTFQYVTALLFLSGGLMFWLAPTASAANTLIVTNTNDSGTGSLRQAILDANNNPGLDTITFNISGTNVHTIAPSTPLPPINEPVIIDGTTQAGFTTNNKPVIEINGASAGAQAGLRFNA